MKIKDLDGYNDFINSAKMLLSQGDNIKEMRRVLSSLERDNIVIKQIDKCISKIPNEGISIFEFIDLIKHSYTNAVSLEQIQMGIGVPDVASIALEIKKRRDVFLVGDIVYKILKEETKEFFYFQP